MGPAIRRAHRLCESCIQAKVFHVQQGCSQISLLPRGTIHYFCPLSLGDFVSYVFAPPATHHYIPRPSFPRSQDFSPAKLPPVARIIAIANQKGGVGKTTTAVNLAASLAVAEQRTLLIDSDPQGNATSGIGIGRDQLADAATLYDVLLGEATIADTVRRAVQFRYLDVLPTTPDLAGAEVELVDRPRRTEAMRDALAAVRDQYDYVLIDCPPSLGLITVNMLAAADALLIPLQCEY